jgi:acetolactate synthase-1/2/3 large subunit
MQYPRQVATLTLPADAAWSPAEGCAPPLPFAAPAPVVDDAIARVAELLRNGRRTAILLAGDSLSEAALLTAGRVAAATGARLLCDTFTARLARGAGQVPIERIPYFVEQIVDLFAQFEQVVLVGAKAPVAFFAYPDKPSKGLAESTTVSVLAHPHEDGPAALSALAEALGALDTPAVLAELKVDGSTEGRFDQFGIGRIIAAHLPEGAIVSEEAATSSLGAQFALVTAAPHEILSLMGGSIGQGLPVATGAAIACPDRKVVCLHGDGGAMYTLQALWTQARERLDVTTVVFANRRYAILDIELGRVGAMGNEVAGRMFDLADPELQWVDLARGMGVEGVRVSTLESFADAFGAAMRTRGPRLIEVML